ncbi:hypothetical protein [Streptomyces sp. NPDC003077]|uniref:TolB family protein n=1 Tax=Streptomyces sp. NPDC003077 TaxID=3154443 RepID=UPI0033A07004
MTTGRRRALKGCSSTTATTATIATTVTTATTVMPAMTALGAILGTVALLATATPAIADPSGANATAPAATVATSPSDHPSAPPTRPANERPAIERLSVTADGTQGDASSTSPSISADGRRVAFGSYASTFVPGETGKVAGVYVKDVRSGRLERIAAGDARPGGSVGEPVISGNGRYVAYRSEWVDVNTPGPYHGYVSDILVRDLRTGRTEQVDVGLEEGYGVSAHGPAISHDGRYVAFGASSFPVTPGPSRPFRIFVRDRVAGTTEVVSAPPEDGATAATSARISADGRVVAYQAHVPILGGKIPRDVYAVDRRTGRVHRVDAPYDGSPSQRQSELTGISADGRYVVFDSPAANITADDPNGDGANVFVRDLWRGTTRRIDAADPARTTEHGELTADGRHLVYRDSGVGWVVRDLRTGRTRTALPPSAGGDRAAVDADGRSLVFDAYGALVPEDTNNTYDVYLRRVRQPLP